MDTTAILGKAILGAMILGSDKPQTVESLLESLLTDTAIPDDFVACVLNRLNTFGVTVTENDVSLVAFSIQLAFNTICNDCNIRTLPTGLFYVAVDMVCGEYLNALKNMNKLNIDGFDLSGTIKQIKEGDTSVTFDESTSDEARLSAFIHYLLYGRRGEFACYRKMAW